MSMVKSCISCATISGAFLPPGGIVFETPHWMVVLRADPVRFPCLPLIILKRHVEDMAYEDIAAVTGVGLSALRMRVKRACDVLRARLTEVIGDE